MDYSQPMSQADDIGRVVLCSAEDCAYNQAAKCTAESVHVNRHQDHADCNTYTNNRHPSEMSEQQERM